MKLKLRTNKFSFRTRIFLSMILITAFACGLLALISIHQFSNQAKEYHKVRLERKEFSVQEHINYILKTTTYSLTTENLPFIFKDRIFELSKIHGLEIQIFDLDGNLLKTSRTQLTIDPDVPVIPKYILKGIESSGKKNFVEVNSQNQVNIRSSYSYIKDFNFKPLGIVCLPNVVDDEFYTKEINEFLVRLFQVYFILFLTSIIIAYFLSNYITQNLQIISRKIVQTNLDKVNEKIIVDKPSQEINILVDAYNEMVEKLHQSAVELAQSQRDIAWREMAKQVAHEIKNPLTPMRLSVQSFQRRFDSNDPDIYNKLEEYSKTLIQQIDTMSSVATAFSSFAALPAQQNETLDVVYVVNLALEIFNEDYIYFESSHPEIITEMDRTQLIRVITNLVKNAIQATSENKNEKKIEVKIVKLDNDILISVEDNGKGIKVEYKDKIFEPKFTTKSSGMGLGLGIIKNIVQSYKGDIWFVSIYGKGSIFYVKFPVYQS